jgi:hypothetical protein
LFESNSSRVVIQSSDDDNAERLQTKAPLGVVVAKKGNSYENDISVAGSIRREKQAMPTYRDSAPTSQQTQIAS